MGFPLKAIAAASLDRVIGKDGDLPWRLSEDLKWFKKITSGHTILMGRKTWESLGRPLPNRRNVVLSRTMEAVEGMEVVRSLEPLGAGKPSLLGSRRLPLATLTWPSGATICWGCTRRSRGRTVHAALSAR